MRRALRACFGFRVWAMALYGLLGFPLGLLGVGYLLVLVVAGPVVTPLARWFRPAAAARDRLLAGLEGLTRIHRALARGLLDQPVTAPAASRPGITNPDTWRAVLYLVLKLPVHYGAFWFCYLFWVPGSALVMFPLWWGAVPGWLAVGSYDPDPDPLWALGVNVGAWPGSLLMSVAGLLIVAAAPSASRIILVDGRLVRLLLGPTDAQRLRASRAAAVDDATARLRRIERDLHDGAQAQIAALAMRLGMAREELGTGDVAAALALIDAAHSGAKDALVELRNLARGIHPPILDDGLGAALETLTARSAVPVDLWYTLVHRPTAAIETIAYFSAAELLANVAKHSGATRAVVLVEPMGTGRLRLLVCDDGVGGARPDGGGLAGLAERAATVDGRVTVTSPPGGPTVVSVELPVSV